MPILAIALLILAMVVVFGSIKIVPQGREYALVRAAHNGRAQPPPSRGSSPTAPGA